MFGNMNINAVDYYCISYYVKKQYKIIKIIIKRLRVSIHCEIFLLSFGFFIPKNDSRSTRSC